MQINIELELKVKSMIIFNKISNAKKTKNYST